MALVQPTNLFPSSFRGSGGDVIDASVSNTFSMQLNGSSPCVAYALKIMQNDAESTAVYTINKTSLATPIYPRDHTNTPQRLEIVIPSTSGMTNGYANGYKWNVSLYWDNSNYIKSADTFFKTEATPYFTVVDPPSTVTSKSVTLTATYTQANGVPLEWYRWTISDANGNIVADTGEVYSEDIQIEVDGLLNDETFSYAISGQTQSGVTIADSTGTFDVSYEAPAVQGDASFSCNPRTGALTVSFPTIRVITGQASGSYSFVTDTPIADNTSISIPSSKDVTFSTVNGATMSLPSDATHVWSGVPTGNTTLYQFTESTESGTKTGTLSKNSAGFITYAYNGQTVVSFSTEDQDINWIVAIMYKNTVTIQTWLYDTIYPSNTLYPSETLLPGVGAGWRPISRYTENLYGVYAAGRYVGQIEVGRDSLRITFLQAGEYSIIFNDTEARPIAPAISGDRAAGEVVIAPIPTTDPYYIMFTVYDGEGRFLGIQIVRMNWPADGESSPSPSIDLKSVKISGAQTANYIMVTEGTLTDSQKEELLNVEYSDADMQYSAKTLILAKFDDSLDAGNYTTNGVDIVGWDIYKQLAGTSNLQFVAAADSTQSEIIDCLVKNGQEYYYYLFPQGESVVGSPIVSQPISSNVWNWVLFTATESDTANVLNVTNSYVFQGNVDTGSISNNADSSVLKNFTRYPKIIKGTQNYRSGRLSALVGYIDTAGNTYTESSALRDAIFALSTNDERMFLKSRAGDIWEVSIHSAISMDVADKSPYQPHTATIDWTEIGSTSGLSLVGESGA